MLPQPCPFPASPETPRGLSRGQQPARSRAPPDPPVLILWDLLVWKRGCGVATSPSKPRHAAWGQAGRSQGPAPRAGWVSPCPHAGSQVTLCSSSPGTRAPVPGLRQGGPGWPGVQGCAALLCYGQTLISLLSLSPIFFLCSCLLIFPVPFSFSSSLSPL